MCAPSVSTPASCCTCRTTRRKAPCAAGTSPAPGAFRGPGRPRRTRPSGPAPNWRPSTRMRRGCGPTTTWWSTAASVSGPATPGSCSTTCLATRTCVTTTGHGPSGGTASASPSPAGRARDRCHAASPAAGDSRRLQRRHGPGTAAAAAGVLPGAAAAPGPLRRAARSARAGAGMPDPPLPGRRGGTGRDGSPVLRRASRGADHPRLRRHSARRARRAERRSGPGHPGGVHQPARAAGPGKPAAAARHGGDAGPDQAPGPRAARLTPPPAPGRVTAAAWEGFPSSATSGRAALSYRVSVPGRADRTRVGPFAGVDADGDDARGLDADDGVLEPLPELLASGGDHGRGPAHLDHARLPWRQHVVDLAARPPGALHIAEFLVLAHPHAAHVDRIVLGVVAKRRRHHVRLPVRADSGDPAQSLLCEVLEFLAGEHAHAALTGQPAAAFQKSRS